jgi:2-polyprenyl-6-methoxyphenol hydroxylase-like FAD-dependent oxidoreductase
VVRAEGKAGGDTVIVRLKDGWCWLIPIDGERTSVGVVLTGSEMRARGGMPAAVFDSVVGSAPKLKELLAHAVAQMEFHVTADYSYFREELAGERVLLAGDAGGFFDPIFSSGVYVALESAKQAVALLLKARPSGRVLTLAERARYTRGIKKHADVFRRLIEVFYDNDAFSVFMCPSPPMDLACGINSVVAGHARLIWPLWWRYQVFMAVCRLQKRFPLVPRIEWKAA